MNIIDGMMMPEMNCAPNDAWYSSSFLSSNAFSASCCRPNTLTRLCPVKVSSTRAFSSPVLRHCATNFGCDRLAISVVTTSDSGMAISATSASSGEMISIITSTPTTVSSEVSVWDSVCCRRLRDVVDVVGDPAEHLTALVLVQVAQRQPVQLVLDLGAQLEDGALHDAVEQVALQVAEDRGQHVQHQHQHQHAGQRGEVDALAGDQRHRRQHGRRRCRCPGARAPSIGLLLGDARPAAAC